MDQQTSPASPVNHDAEPVMACVSEIVAAYVTRHDVPADQLPGLVSSVKSALADDPAVTPDEAVAPPKPAVAKTKSYTDESVTCLVCGKRMTSLKRHLRSAHGMDESTYRETFKLSRDHPLVAPSYSRDRAAWAKKIGLGQRSDTATQASSARSGKTSSGKTSRGKRASPGKRKAA